MTEFERELAVSVLAGDVCERCGLPRDVCHGIECLQHFLIWLSRGRGTVWWAGDHLRAAGLSPPWRQIATTGWFCVVFGASGFIP